MEPEIVAPEAPVEAEKAPEIVLDLDVKGLAAEALVYLESLAAKVGDHVQGKGLRSTIAFVAGRFQAEIEQIGL